MVNPSASRSASALVLIAAAGALTAPAAAQEVSGTFPTPTLDRWMYPFNGEPGTKAEATTFGTLGEVGFDNRDGQIILGWDTDGSITPGLGVDAYQIRSARVTVEISRDLTFTYDDTFDALETYFDAADAAFIADADAGRPLELFALGYRAGSGGEAGWSLETFQETSPFRDDAGTFPARQVRNAFAINFDEQGAPFDISNNARDSRLIPMGPFFPFEVKPLSIGQTDAVAPGQLVPIGTQFTFDLDLSDPHHRAYIAEALDAGRLNVVIATLHQVEGQGDAEAPAVTMKEDPFGTPAKLELTACIGSAADLDCSGAVDVFDLLAYLDGWFAGAADLDGNGATDVFDLLAYLDAWFLG